MLLFVFTLIKLLLVNGLISLTCTRNFKKLKINEFLSRILFFTLIFT